ncbi:MAG: hypothetical protein AUI54_02945 [Acidobacteria bacterium 13_1_40CM_2_56_5]|nr:MAG: hypothetical protein AUI54_02945 [Acidobacteria bacterium 13_1_40CM_2_56_5]
MLWAEHSFNPVLTNPYNCLPYDEFGLPHEPIFSEDEFVLAGLKITKFIGPEAYIRSLLQNLKGNLNTSDDPACIVIRTRH